MDLTSLIGTTYPTLARYEVSREKIREFAFALYAVTDSPFAPTPPPDAAVPAQVHSAFLERRAAEQLGYRDVIAPPTLAVMAAQKADALFLSDPAHGLPLDAVVHGEQSFTFERPIQAGDELVASLTVDRVRVIAGNAMITTTHALKDAAGDLVCRATSMLIVRLEPPADAATTRPALVSDAPMSTPPGTTGAFLTISDHREPEVGEQIGSADFHWDRATLVRYAGASTDFNPIHFHDEYAAAAGLPGVIAHGMLTMGAAALVPLHWRRDPGAVASYGVRFTNPIVVPRTGSTNVQCKATVGAIDPATNQTRVDLKVTHHGTAVLAKARLSLRGE